MQEGWDNPVSTCTHTKKHTYTEGGRENKLIIPLFLGLFKQVILLWTTLFLCLSYSLVPDTVEEQASLFLYLMFVLNQLVYL